MEQATTPTDEVAEMVVALRHVATAKKRRGLKLDRAARIYVLIVSILCLVAIGGAALLYNLVDPSHALLRALGW